MTLDSVPLSSCRSPLSREKEEKDKRRSSGLTAETDVVSWISRFSRHLDKDRMSGQLALRGEEEGGSLTVEDAIGTFDWTSSGVDVVDSPPEEPDERLVQWWHRK